MSLTIEQIKEDFKLAKQNLFTEDLENIDLENINLEEHNKLMVYLNKEYENQDIKDESYINRVKEFVQSDINSYNDFTTTLQEIILGLKVVFDIELPKEILESKNKLSELFTEKIFKDIRFYTPLTKEEQLSYCEAITSDIYKENQNKLKEFKSLL